MAIHLDSIRPVFDDERHLLVTDLRPDECQARLTGVLLYPERQDPSLVGQVEKDRFVVARGGWAVVRAIGELIAEAGHTRIQVDLAWSGPSLAAFLFLALLATLLPFAAYFLPAIESWPRDGQSVFAQLVAGWLAVLVVFGLSHWLARVQKAALLKDLQATLEAEDMTVEA